MPLTNQTLDSTLTRLAIPYGINALEDETPIPARNKETPEAGTRLMLLDPRLITVIAVPTGIDTEDSLGMLMLVVPPEAL